MGLVRSWCLRMVSFQRFVELHGLIFVWWIYCTLLFRLVARAVKDPRRGLAIPIWWGPTATWLCHTAPWLRSRLAPKMSSSRGRNDQIFDSDKFPRLIWFRKLLRFRHSRILQFPNSAGSSLILKTSKLYSKQCHPSTPVDDCCDSPFMDDSPRYGPSSVLNPLCATKPQLKWYCTLQKYPCSHAYHLVGSGLYTYVPW